ncbi:MAG: hypothetical protein JNL11_02245 [Bdellovibrionaceae bacterium]|nr:hypothetical protein [Pseudobdellovibrionaceae bacterium]
MKLIFSIFILCIGVSAFSGELSEMPVRRETFWGNYRKVELKEKVRRAPLELIEYLRKDNEKQGWNNKPTAIDLPNDLLNDVQSALLEIPSQLLQKISAQTVGIFFVEDLGGSAYTDYVFDKNGRSVAGFVVLDKLALSRQANEWATWKESSPFALNSSVTLRATIETKKNDSRKNALQYILLHEFGHLLSIQNPMLPLWGKNWIETKIKPEMSFFHESWKVSDGKLSSLHDLEWPARSLVIYYAQNSKKQPAYAAIESYRRITATKFPTLYAATNPFDDFADSFANYVHVNTLGKPWKIEIDSETTKLVVEPCWDQPRCKSKKLLLERVINEP